MSESTAAKPLSLVLVDDEAPARERMKVLLDDIALELPTRVLGEAGDGESALALIQEVLPEVVLVDIRMPRMDGLELARHLAALPQPPAVIFATAYDNHAVQAFDLNAVDYLLKPVRAMRLQAALDKARRMAPLSAERLARVRQDAGEGPRRHFSCHERGRILLVPVRDVLYLKADLKYVTARTRDREFLLDEALTHLEQEFAEQFIRLHRSVLVAKTALAGFERGHGESDDGEGGGEHWLALLKEVPEKLPVSRRQWALVKQYVK